MKIASYARRMPHGKLDDILMRGYNFGREHKGFTVLADGPSFDCDDPVTMKKFIAWARKKGAKKIVWIVSVTHNEGTNFEELLRRLTQQEKIAERLETRKLKGLVVEWGIGGFEDKGQANIDYSAVLFDVPEQAVIKIAKAKRGCKLVREHVPQNYVTKIDLVSGKCSFLSCQPEVV